LLVVGLLDSLAPGALALMISYAAVIWGSSGLRQWM
jgi:hypothetical protein